MFGRDKGDRGALVAFGLLLLSVVLVFLVDRLGYPANEAIEQAPKKQGADEYTYRESVETVYWGIFTSRDTLAQWIAALAAIGSAGVSVLAVRLVRESLAEARKATKTAQDALVAQSRPWLKIVSAHTLEMITSPDQIELKLEIELENIGNSPALHVSIRTRLYLDAKPAWEMQEAETDQTRLYRNHTKFSETLFNGETRRQLSFASLNKEQILRYYEDRKRRLKVKPGDYHRPLKESYMSCVLYVSVAYQSPSIDQVHLSSAVFFLRRGYPGQPTTHHRSIGFNEGQVDLTETYLDIQNTYAD